MQDIGGITVALPPIQLPLLSLQRPLTYMVIKQMEAQDLYPLELVTNVPMNFHLNTKCPSMSVFLFNIFSFLFFIIIFDNYFLFQNNFFNLQINFVWDIFLIA